MALRDLSDPAAVNAAMDEYERIGAPAFHAKYKSGTAVRYFVVRNGVEYDSKAIAAAAHGYQFGEPLDPADSRFFGGLTTVVPKLESLGFEIRDSQEPDRSVEPLSSLFEQMLELLPAALEEEFKEHPLGPLLRNDIPEQLRDAIPQAGYKVEGSPGRGNWAETVWVSVFDQLITITAQAGYYLVYLVPKDGSGVYLSLNQGATTVLDEVGRRRYLSVLRNRADVYAGLLDTKELEGLIPGELDLRGSGTLTRGYQAANVAAVYYEAGAVPDDDELRADLQRFLELYRKLIEANDLLTEDETPADPDAEPADTDEDNTEPSLEAKKLRWHLRAERNPKLARDAKRHHGSTCMICGFNYSQRYGPLGDGYIEAHHLTPFSELGDRPTQLDPTTDFAVVCANCHRMLHKRRPPYDLDTIRDALR